MKQKKTIAQRISPRAKVAVENVQIEHQYRVDGSEVKLEIKPLQLSDVTDQIRKGIYPDPRQLPLF